MPLLPIDLQTLFTQAHQVGKEQSTQKDLVPNAQAASGSVLARETEERDKKVNETQKQDNGTEKVRQKTRREGRKGHDSSGAEEEKKGSEKGGQDVFRDPDLGSRVDISG
jgi:ribosome assembly protein YihI (activator of Der GTPase)